MPFKMDGDNVATVEHEGKRLPIFVYPDGKESPFDGDATVGSIKNLNGEAKGHRERAEALEKQYKPFEGLDPAAARKALETVANLDAIVSGKVDEVQKAVDAKFEKDRKTLEAERDAEREGKLTFRKQRDANMIAAAFTGSKFIRETSAVPADMVQAMFSRHFSVDDNGVMVATDDDGSQIHSMVNPRDLAKFDEAIGILWEAYPNKDAITKGSSAIGSGALNGIQNTAGGKTINRSAYNKLSPTEQGTIAREGKVKIID